MATLVEVPATTRNFQEELKLAQAQVKALGATREKLMGDARVEARNVELAIETLTGLGIQDAAQLSITDMATLREKTQAQLENSLNELKEQIALGNDLVAEYNAVAV